MADATAADAEHGEKMVEIKVRFWTDGIAEEKGKILPKHVWGGGVVRVAPNRAHGIRAEGPIPFNSLMELTSVVEKALIRSGITVHLSDRMDRYLDGQP